MKKIAFLLMMLLPLGVSAQKQQDDMSKYLAGAVPTQNGIVIFEKSFEVPDKSKSEIYDGLKTYFTENILQGENVLPQTRIQEEQPEAGIMAIAVEEYLYFNDDMYPMQECKAEDFFRDGKGVIGMSSHFWPSNMYKTHCRSSYRAACQAMGKKPGLCFLRPQHICSPMLKSKCEELYSLIKKQIHASVTRVRSNGNLNQYLYLDYLYLSGKIVNKRQPKKHFSVGVASAKSLCQFIMHPTHRLACINDVQLSEERYAELKKAMLYAFNQRFPKKSKFEV